MLKNVFWITMVVVLSVALTSFAQVEFDSPESVVFDYDNDRYFVSNKVGGEIIEIDSNGEMSYFNTDQMSVRGLHISDGILYGASSAGVAVMDLETGSTITTVEISGSAFLNDITSDLSGNLYISDSNANKIFRMSMDDYSYNVFVDGLYNPNGIWFDDGNDRLLLCSYRGNSPIQAISLVDSTVTTIVETELDNLDGMTEDNDGNIYVSSWSATAVYRFDPDFSNDPELISSGHYGPADIYYNLQDDILAVPNFNSDDVDFIYMSPNALNVPTQYETIQSAINAASDGDTVLVADGTYTETINFSGKNILLTSHYLLDGNPNHILNTIIDGSEPDHPDTASCVLIINGEDDAILQGFTLTGGIGTLWPDPHNGSLYREGGGILMEYCSPTIRNNLILNNDAIDKTGAVSAGGGGIRCSDGDPLIENNVIMMNRGRYGGGIVMNYATGTIRNNVICQNTGGEDYGGSGIWTYESGATIIENNTIVANHSELRGGGIRVWGTAITASNNIIWGNTATLGDAQIQMSGTGSVIEYCDVEGGWDGTGNIDADPLFDELQLYLTETSPCIDAGDPQSPDDPDDPENPGNALFPSMGDLTNDMGAYGGAFRTIFPEFSSPTITLNQQTFEFDGIAPGETDTLHLIIQNNGVAPLYVDDIQISTTTISVQPSAPFYVDMMAEQVVTIIWTPTEEEDVLDDELLIYHNDEYSEHPAVAYLTVTPFTRLTDGAVVTDGGDSRSANWVDYDNDGYLDLFVSNGLSGGQSNFLYQNNTDGTFTKIIDGDIVSDNRSSDGSSWADYDNDGDADAFVVNWYNQDNLFYVNNGDGSLSHISDGEFVEGGYSEDCSWADYDNDGDPDLYVTNSGYSSAMPNFLYRNDNGTLVKVTEGSIVTEEKFSRGSVWADYDNDGDNDLFVASESDQDNCLYQNNGDGTFAKVISGDIVTDGGNSKTASWGDYDNDGDFDLFVGNTNNQNNFLYQNDGDGSFIRITSGVVANDGGWTFGSAWADYDNDGDLDLFVANGHHPNPSITHKNFLYQNNGDGTFTKISTGEIANDEGWSYGAAFGDYDRDGDLDLFVAKWLGHTENNALYRNNGNKNNWLEVECVGTASGKSAIGTKVKVKAVIDGEAIWQVRQISSHSGYCGQNAIEAHFGLGDATIVDSVIIQWQSGLAETAIDIDVNQRITAVEGNNVNVNQGDIKSVPQKARLFQNYPNPFNPNTTIAFQIPEGAQDNFLLRIYDSSGKLVRTLFNRPMEAGHYTVIWDGKDNNGTPLNSGVYFYKMQGDGDNYVRQCVLLK